MSLFRTLAIATILAAAGALASFDAPAQHFDVGDVRGDYAFSIEGELTIDGVTSPFVAVGTTHADGEGAFVSARRIVNLNGLTLVQTGSGTYDVDSEGVAKAEFEVTTIEPPGFLPPYNERYAFVLADRRGREAELVLLGNDLGTIVASGRARRQR